MGNNVNSQRRDCVYFESNFYRAPSTEIVSYWIQDVTIVNVQKVVDRCWVKFSIEYFSVPFYFRGDIADQFCRNDTVDIEYYSLKPDPAIYICSISLRNKKI